MVLATRRRSRENYGGDPTRSPSPRIFATLTFVGVSTLLYVVLFVLIDLRAIPTNFDHRDAKKDVDSRSPSVSDHDRYDVENGAGTIRFEGEEETSRSWSIGGNKEEGEKGNKKENKKGNKKENKKGNKKENKKDDEDDLPEFVLHVGPGKTGTTTLQKYFHLPSTKRLLSRDDYTVLGHKMMHQKIFFTKDEHDEDVFAVSSFVPTVNALRKVEGGNVFASSEYLQQVTPSQCRLWRRTFMDSSVQRWNVRIVFTYRRLHERLPSLWNQRFKFCRTCDAKTEYTKHKHWPGIQGDHRIPSFEEWFVDNYFNKHKHQDIANNNFKAKYDSWGDCSHERSLVSIHDSLVNGEEHDMLVNFACKGLNGAKSTCSHLLENFNSSRVYSKIKSNPSQNHDYDMLAVHAYEHGMLGDAVRKDNRLRIGSMIRRYVESNNLAESLPMICPNATVTDFLYRWSLETEKWASRYLPRPARAPTKEKNQIDEEEEESYDSVDFHAGWERTLAANKLCAVNATEFFRKWPVLSHEAWYVGRA